MRLDDEADEVRSAVDDLALRCACLDEWRAADARMCTVMQTAQQQLAALQRRMTELVKSSQPGWSWFATLARARELHELLDDLRVLEICVRSRIFELETDDDQRYEATR
ncbi:MAG TPA: hypothetical protein VIV11_23140 [Kofleriaceae bacterium]